MEATPPMMEAVTPMSREQRVEAIARACHEANRAWCESHGDASQRPWDDAEQWQRDSAIEGVAAALEGKGPEALHVAWCESKERDGWTLGTVKDAEAKTHPCLVPYADLPAFQKTKDSLFLAVVGALAPSLGL